MSYILDALKKAERERTVAQLPTLMSVHDARSDTPRRRPWIVLVCCLLCTAALTWILVYLLTPQRGQMSPIPESSIEQKTQTQSPPHLPLEPAKTVMPSESPISHEIRSEPGNTPARATNQQDRKSIPETVRAIQSGPATEMPVPVEKRTIQVPSAIRNGMPPAPEGASTAQGAHSSPASLHEAMAKMTMTILMYSDVQSERMAFINDRKYMEGEYVDGLYLLESITPEGAVLNYQGERALLRSRAK